MLGLTSLPTLASSHLFLPHSFIASLFRSTSYIRLEGTVRQWEGMATLLFPRPRKRDVVKREWGNARHGIRRMDGVGFPHLPSLSWWSAVDGREMTFYPLQIHSFPLFVRSLTLPSMTSKGKGKEGAYWISSSMMVTHWISSSMIWWHKFLPERI